MTKNGPSPAGLKLIGNNLSNGLWNWCEDETTEKLYLSSSVEDFIFSWILSSSKPESNIGKIKKQISADLNFPAWIFNLQNTE